MDHLGSLQIIPLCVVKNIIIAQYTGEDHLQVGYVFSNKDKVHLKHRYNDVDAQEVIAF